MYIIYILEQGNWTKERINVYFNEATGGRYVPRAVLMDLEPGMRALSTVTFNHMCCVHWQFVHRLSTVDTRS